MSVDTNVESPYLCVVENLPKGLKHSYPFKEGDKVVMLGEIQFMPGHVVVVLPDGKVVFGFRSEYFRRLTLEEI